MSYRVRQYPSLAAAWMLNGNALDGLRRYPGTLVNAPTWSPTAPKGSGQCVELDGDDAHVNVGDVVELNAVSAFTLSFWMNQDVIDIADDIFVKLGGANQNIQVITRASGNMLFIIASSTNSYGQFDYSTVISAANWHHVAMVYDGSQIGNANRLLVYVDGNPVTLGFNLTIPAVTYDLAGQDALIGNTALSFDGRFWGMELHSAALSRDEVRRAMHAPVGVF